MAEEEELTPDLSIPFAPVSPQSALSASEFHADGWGVN